MDVVDAPAVGMPPEHHGLDRQPVDGAPEIEASASDNPAQKTGSGLSSVEAGLRQRYEIRREFAPYVGVEWSRSFGDTADYIEARAGEADDTRFVIGLKAWF